jgi:Na+/melibiose symporter-like transporter
MPSPRDLRLLVGAVGLSAAGDFVALIALVLHVHDLTGSGLAVSALFAATMVPVVALAPLAGLLADRVESVRLLVLASLAQGLVAAGLAFTDSLASILLLSALLGLGSAISQPAEFALVPAVARTCSPDAAGSHDQGRLTQANGWVETARYAGFAIGPLVAAALTAGGGSRLALLVNAASFAAIALAAACMRTRRPPVPATSHEGRDRARDGFRFLWRDDLLRVLVGAAVLGLLFISASLTVEVFYVKDVVGAGDAGYALTGAAWMIGMVAGATGLAGRAARGGAAAMAGLALAALAAQGAGMAFAASWAILPVVIAGYVGGGLAHGLKNVLIRTVIQERVPERLHGRAFAAYNGLRNTAELGALGAGGVLVSVLGAQLALLGAGLGCVAAGLLGLGLIQRRGAPARATAAAASG